MDFPELGGFEIWCKLVQVLYVCLLDVDVVSVTLRRVIQIMLFPRDTSSASETRDWCGAFCLSLKTCRIYSSAMHARSCSEPSRACILSNILNGYCNIYYPTGTPTWNTNLCILIIVIKN